MPPQPLVGAIRKATLLAAALLLWAGAAPAREQDRPLSRGVVDCTRAACGPVCRCLFDRFDPDRRLRYGYGMTADPARAAYWYRRAAAAGDVRAQYNLALMVARGQGVAKDPPAAARLLQAAADRGLVEAMHALAGMHRDGEGVPRDLSAAFRLYREGAAAGHAPSQHALANLLADGRGTATDLVTAWVWWKRASLKGNLPARDALARAERMMTLSELIRARRRFASPSR